MFIEKNWLAIILCISCITISIAFIAQYVFFIIPCEICYYQRYTYYLIIFTSIIFLSGKIKFNLFYLILIEIFLFVGLIFSIWHFGVENNLIQGSSGCTLTEFNFNNDNAKNLEELKNIIKDNPIAQCNEINWSFLGISMVFYNIILQFVLIIINTILIKRHK